MTHATGFKNFQNSLFYSIYHFSKLMKRTTTSPMFVLIAKKNHSYHYIFTLSCSHRAIIYVSRNLAIRKDILSYMRVDDVYLLPCSISQLYAKNDSIHDHNTRCSNLLRVPIGSKSFTSVSARIWNVLYNIIVFDVPISNFKSLLKQYLLYNSLSLTYSK